MITKTGENNSTSVIEVQASVIIGRYAIDALTHEKTYFVVEEPASSLGGMEIFYTNLRKEIVYPKSASKAKIEGKVFVEFIIGENGVLKNTKVPRGIGVAGSV